MKTKFTHEAYLSTCAVCGYPGLPPNRDIEKTTPAETICPCCLFHFGLDDWSQDDTPPHHLYADYRSKWVRDGMRWRGSRPVPPGWSPLEQLRDAVRC